ncbi:uncharacterized protein LOC144152172 isoform X1 [Haemaphysalis longicornis]
MKCPTDAAAFFRNLSGLAHGLVGVVQCTFAVLFKISRLDSFEFGMNLMLGATNILLGCAAATVETQRTECRNPREYVSLNRLSVVLFWNSALFNGICSLVLFLLPTELSPAMRSAPTQFHRHWFIFIDYVVMASLLAPVAVVVLACCCLLTLTRSPLRDVLPSRGAATYTQEAKDDFSLRPFKWVYPSSDCSSQRDPRPWRKPLSPCDATLPYPPPRFTFHRCSGAGPSQAGPSRANESRLSQPGGPRPSRPRSSDDDDDDILDSFISDSFDEGGAATDDHAFDTDIPRQASHIDDSRAATSKGYQRPQVRRMTPANRGEDSLANLTNLELIARQWRTSAMLRKIWRSSERSTSKQLARLDHPLGARD